MTSAIPRAAFDVPLDARNREGARLNGAFHAEPDQILIARSTAEVPVVVAAAEDAALRGSWVIGALSYEAGGAWEPAQATRPARGPLAWFEVYREDPKPWDPSETMTDTPAWFPDPRFTTATPAQAIEEVGERIRAGDCYQVNLTGRYSAELGHAQLYRIVARLAARQPGGYLFHLDGPGIASASPELFVQRHLDGRITTQPMKGTAPAGRADLLSSAKERAENLMIVDLLRNDLSRICRPGSVRVEGLFELIRLPTLWQQVSTVSGLQRQGTDLNGVLAALFPCGSVTGAPRIEAMSVIASLEAEPRGWYCGAVLLLRPGGELISAVTIRTVERDGQWWRHGVGSGIVADSIATAELAEWRAKAAFLDAEPLRALETLRLENGSFPLLGRHLSRLSATSQALGLDIDLDAAALALNQLAMSHPEGAHRVRLLADADRVSVEVGDLVATTQPVLLAIATRPLAVDHLAPLITNKTSHRAHYDRLRAQAPPGAFDVICHTREGWITEATLGNLAFRLAGTWVTPPVGRGLLPGTLRAELLAHGLLIEADVHLDHLAEVEEIAFLNGTRGWCPAELIGTPSAPVPDLPGACRDRLIPNPPEHRGEP